jgi:hypothetical protein
LAAQLRQPKQSKLQNHTTFLWTIWQIWVGRSIQTAQTVKATKPQHISLDDIKKLSWPLNTGNPNRRSYKTTAHFFGRYQKFELVAKATQADKPQNHTLFLLKIPKIWVGSSTQATQTVEATKPQHIFLDDKKNLSLLLNTGSPNSQSHKTTPKFYGDKADADNSGNPNSQSYRTTPNFSGRYKEFELSTQHRQPKPSKPKNHIIRKPQTKPYFSDDKAVFTF